MNGLTVNGSVLRGIKNGGEELEHLYCLRSWDKHVGEVGWTGSSAFCQDWLRVIYGGEDCYKKCCVVLQTYFLYKIM